MKIAKKHLEAFSLCVEIAVADGIDKPQLRLLRGILGHLREEMERQKIRPTAYMVQSEQMMLQHGRDHFELKFPKDLREKCTIEIPLYTKEQL